MTDADMQSFGISSRKLLSDTDTDRTLQTVQCSLTIDQAQSGIHEDNSQTPDVLLIDHVVHH